MADTKYGKYILSELKDQHIPDAPWAPKPNPDFFKTGGGRVMYLDSSIIAGASYLECVWVMPHDKPLGEGIQRHVHDYDEILCFFGTDPADFHNLNGEIEIYLEDERHTFTKTSVVFVPAGMKHCPMRSLWATKPIFHFTAHAGKSYR